MGLKFSVSIYTLISISAKNTDTVCALSLKMSILETKENLQLGKMLLGLETFFWVCDNTVSLSSKIYY